MVANSKKQSDFGKIYHATPSHVFRPKTVEQLAKILAQLNRAGKPVKIRNTGHSVNGQTLTHGVQVDVSGIHGVHFDREKNEVTAGCGASWDKVFRMIGLPNFVTPVFPSNPGQRIHIGGTASVGGIGFWSSSRGGLWNHIRRITLVTMTGEIVHCSAEHRSDLFRFALCGYGRIGVIAELTVAVEASAPEFELAVAMYHSEKQFIEDYSKTRRLSGIDLVVATDLMPKALRTVGLYEHCLFLGLQVHTPADSQRLGKIIGRLNPHDVVLYGHPANKTLDFLPGEQRFSLKDLVYWYPKPKSEHQLLEHHPWGDYSVHPDRYHEFMEALRELTDRFAMHEFMHKHAIWHKWFDVPLVGSYPIRVLSKHPETEFPLSPDCGFDGYYFGVAVESNVPQAKLPDALHYIRAVTDLAYSLGGKQYLYGYHNLSPEQVEQHFGRATIHRWQHLKDSLDPHHLLNIGVVEHLD